MYSVEIQKWLRVIAFLLLTSVALISHDWFCYESGHVENIISICQFEDENTYKLHYTEGMDSDLPKLPQHAE